jgi:hypothetical protein
MAPRQNHGNEIPIRTSNEEAKGVRGGVWRIIAASFPSPRRAPPGYTETVYRRGYPVSPGYYPPIPVIPPYAGAYYLPSPIVITAPYFCVLHNEAFVSRIGMIDHLSGMHGMLLDAAAPICPDAAGNCIFPSY